MLRRSSIQTADKDPSLSTENDQQNSQSIGQRSRNEVSGSSFTKADSKSNRKSAVSEKIGVDLSRNLSLSRHGDVVNAVNDLPRLRIFSNDSHMFFFILLQSFVGRPY